MNELLTDSTVDSSKIFITQPKKPRKLYKCILEIYVVHNFGTVSYIRTCWAYMSLDILISHMVSHKQNIIFLDKYYIP